MELHNSTHLCRIEGHIPEGLFDNTENVEVLFDTPRRIEGHIPEGLFSNTDGVATLSAESVMGNGIYAEDRNVSSAKRKRKLSKDWIEFATDIKGVVMTDILSMLLMAMIVLLLNLVLTIPVWGWIMIAAYYIWCFGMMAYSIFFLVKNRGAGAEDFTNEVGGDYDKERNASHRGRKKKLSKLGIKFITASMGIVMMGVLSMLLMAMAVLLLSLVLTIPVWGWVLIGAYCVWSFGAMAHEILTTLKKKSIFME